MATVIFQSEPHPSGGAEWIVELDPTNTGNPRLVRFLRRTSQRKLLDQIAEWLPRDPAAVTRAGVWNHRRWVPKSPIVPQWLIQKVEDHMRMLGA